MDIRNMRQLLAVRTHGSFAKAAQALGMSQPSLSAAITRMEDQLKVKLFERTATGSELTPIGEMIAERAAKVVAETQQMIRDAELVAGGEAGSLRVGIGASLRGSFLPPFVRALAESYGLLSIEFEVLDRDRLLPLVKSRDLDLAVMAFGEDIAAEGLLATEVLTCDVLAVARPDHELVGQAAVPLARFAEFTGGGVNQAQFSNASILDAPGPAEPQLRYRSNDYDALLELALGGYATLIAPQFVVQPHLDSGRLKPIALDWSYRVSFAAVTTRAAAYSPLVSRIVRQAAAVGAALQPPS